MSVRSAELSPREGAEWLADYVRSAVDDRAARPGDDLLSRLLASEVAGQPILHDEVFDLIFLLLIAGLDTTTGVMAFGWRHLATHPEDRARVVADPDAAPLAVEELLRHYPVANIARVVTTAVTLGEVTFKPGDRVLLPLTLAHRSGRESDGVRLDLGPRRHYAFGAGPHRCLGSHLARREITIAMQLWHDRIPDYRIQDEPSVVGFGGAIMGLRALPLEWR